MTRLDFAAECGRIAYLKGWRVDFLFTSQRIEAWFCDPANNDADTAQAYMSCSDIGRGIPVGLDIK